jgi:hypothetical protein
MGKYSKYKATLPRIIGSAPNPEDGGTNFWNEEVEAIKRAILASGKVADPLEPAALYDGATKEQLAQAYLKLRGDKERLEKTAKTINKTVEAINRILVGMLEADGASSVRLQNGGGVDLEDAPYCTVEDTATFMAWIKEQGMEDMLVLQWQTMNATVKTRLEAGLEPPPGVKVYLKSSVKRRKAKKEAE